MSKILVTGASGNLGRHTLLHLLALRPASDLVGLVRDPAKAADLTARGVELRQGDYFDRAALARALTGVDTVMLTPAEAFTDRKTAHANVVGEAVAAGVRRIVYTPIARRPGSTLTIPEVTAEDLFTVDALRASGLAYTLAEHPPFLDTLGFHIGANAHETGVLVPPGHGKFAAATRDDLAAAQAAILAGDGHENQTYRLLGAPAVSFAEVAEMLSRIHGRVVPYAEISEEEFLARRRASGLPDAVLAFGLQWVRGMNAGEWQEETGDLERLLGRPPKTAFEFFRDDYLTAR